jgi:peptidyl-tRNA hydrolase
MVVEIGLGVLAAITGYEAYRNRTKIAVAAESDLRLVEAKAKADVAAARTEVLAVVASVRAEVTKLRADLTAVEAKIVAKL